MKPTHMVSDRKMMTKTTLVRMEHRRKMKVTIPRDKVKNPIHDVNILPSKKPCPMIFLPKLALKPVVSRPAAGEVASAGA